LRFAQRAKNPEIAFFIGDFRVFLRIRLRQSKVKTVVLDHHLARICQRLATEPV